ncbi:hypothetical protein Syun_004331 [Stephania yunnanensis]|uniref:HECT-type E3 ubiquitin transferase n=1 Tax=Stephania yunnanensis TaxID=152371 RepID=A0AAP0L654_9MAGN
MTTMMKSDDIDGDDDESGEEHEMAVKGVWGWFAQIRDEEDGFFHGKTYDKRIRLEGRGRCWIITNTFPLETLRYLIVRTKTIDDVTRRKVSFYLCNVSDLELYFVIVNNEYGEQTEEKLLPGGKDIRVTNENVVTYIHLIANHRLNFQVVLKNISRLCGTKPIVTVNKQFPGPTLYAREGDRVLVKVVNHVKYNLSIHWSNIICQVTFHRISKPREITKNKKIWMRSKFGGMPREGWNYK